jgi:HEAT repeat protein
MASPLARMFFVLSLIARTAAAQATTPDDDSAFARAIGFAFEPAPVEIRSLAIEDLALLHDPRALNPLAALIFDPQPLVQSAAVRAISRFQAPRAEEILANVARHPTLPERVRVLALESLVYQRTPGARETLNQFAQSSRFGFVLRDTARRALAELKIPQ